MKKKANKRPSKLQATWSTASATTLVVVLIIVGTFALLASNRHIFAAPATTAVSCTVDPKQKKLVDQDGSHKPWKRNGAKQVVVYFAYGNATAEYKSHVVYGAKTWSKSPCLELKAVAKCPSKGYCIPVQFKKTTGQEYDAAFEKKNKGSYISSGRIELYTNLLADYDSNNDRRSVVTHEMGHAIGLNHRKSKKSIMYEATDLLVPDAIDYQNLRVLYGKQK